MMKKHNGFTLIELLVVITIIGILSAIGLASYRVANQKARDSRRQADIQTIQSALEVYRSQYDRYPTSTNFTSPVFNNSTYFSSGSMPKDPSRGLYYEYMSPYQGSVYRYRLGYDLETDTQGPIYVYNP